MYTDYHHYWWLDKVKPGDKVVCVGNKDAPQEYYEECNRIWHLPNGGLSKGAIYTIKDILSCGSVKWVVLVGFPVIHAIEGYEAGFSPAGLRPLLPSELAEQLDEIESLLNQESNVYV